jgi:hypothetical protein
MNQQQADLIREAIAMSALLVIFGVLTWFNASDFDWELRGEGGTITISTLAAVAYIIAFYIKPILGKRNTEGFRNERIEKRSSGQRGLEQDREGGTCRRGGRTDPGCGSTVGDD